MSTSNGWDVLFKGPFFYIPYYALSSLNCIEDTYAEGGPPTDLADRFTASFPHHMSVGLHQRAARRLAELDKDLLDGLHKVGFRTNLGFKDTGFPLLAWGRAGGYYLGQSP